MNYKILRHHLIRRPPGYKLGFGSPSTALYDHTGKLDLIGCQIELDPFTMCAITIDHRGNAPDLIGLIARSASGIVPKRALPRTLQML